MILSGGTTTLGVYDFKAGLDKDASSVNSANGETQQEINDYNGATWYSKVGGYGVNDEARLVTGEVVISTVPSNTNDPNSNMAGWRKKSITESVVYAESYGVSESIDNTTIYDQIITEAPNGAKIVFPYNKTLLGHFISENKSFSIDFNGSTLVNTLTNAPIVQIGTLAATAYDVTESVLNHGDTQFTVVGASTLFNAGDIGYLWDGATRSTTGSVNYESIKIKSISGDVITVENFLASYKGASAIKFYHTEAQLKNPKFENLKLSPTSDHNFIVSLISNCENATVSNIETTGTTGNAVAIRYCYGLDAKNIRPLKAQSVGSGQGYGLSLFCVSKHKVRDVNGSGMRHVYTQDSAYFFVLHNLSDDDDKSAMVVLAHNGFAGYGICNTVRGTTSQYPISLSEQGYAGEVPALKQNHPFRYIHVKGVNARIRADVDPSTSTSVHGVYFQNSVIGCSVDDVDIEVLNANVMTASSGSSLVRVNGIINKGFTVTNIKANKIGKVFVATGGTRSGFATDKSQTTLRNIQVGQCAYVYHTQGLYYMNVDDVNLSEAPLSLKTGWMQVISTDSPQGAYHGDFIDYALGQGVAQLDCNATSAIAGKLANGIKTSASGITLVDGQTITINELQEKSALVRLNPPVGVGSITVTMPKPQTVGDEVIMTNPSSRYAVVLSGTNMNSSVTVNAGDVVGLRVVGSKWSLVSRSSNV